jgi:uncharacterized protein YutD
LIENVKRAFSLERFAAKIELREINIFNKGHYIVGGYLIVPSN